MLMVGVDPGTTTGVAVWNCDEKRLVAVTSFTILAAVSFVESLLPDHAITLYVEDPNTWKPFGHGYGAAARLQGAGSIKRDFAIWMEFAKDHGLNVIRMRLQGTMKKVPADQFKLMTGWKGTTNEHARDAAMLVFGHGMFGRAKVKQAK